MQEWVPGARSCQHATRHATPEVTYSHNSPGHAVTFTVAPGEVFQVEMLPNCGQAFDSHTGQFTDRPWALNAATGCIAVDGARAAAGQNVVVQVLGTDLGEYGYTAVERRSILLPQLAAEDGWQMGRRVVSIGGGFVNWSAATQIPVAPMIGYLGVARPDEAQSNAHNGRFGGNLDIQELGVGAQLHLPVLVDGAKLHVGDVHAVQGDGEIDGAGGIETGAVLTLKIELANRPRRFRNPRIETDEFIATTGFAQPAEIAFAQALEDLVFWMADDFGFTLAGAHMLLAQVLSARATQFVNPLISYIAKVSRRYLTP